MHKFIRAKHKSAKRMHENVNLYVRFVICISINTDTFKHISNTRALAMPITNVYSFASACFFLSHLLIFLYFFLSLSIYISLILYPYFSHSIHISLTLHPDFSPVYFFHTLQCNAIRWEQF